MFHIFRFPFSRKISLVQECWKNTKLSRYCQLLSASPSESKAEEPRFVSFALFPFLVILFNPLFPLHFLLSSPLAVMFRSTVDMRNSNTDVLTTDCTATSCALYSINFFFNFLFQIAARILEAHSSLNKSSLVESKMLYVRQWQALPEFGLSHFVVRFRGSKKEVIVFNKSKQLYSWKAFQ